MKNTRFIISIYFIVFIIYIPLIFYFKKISKRKISLIRFLRGIISIFENTEDDLKCIDQIQILYKKLSERYSISNFETKSAVQLLEEILFQIDSSPKKQFQSIFKIATPFQYR